SMHTLYVVTFETQLMIIYIILIHISRISTLSPYTTLFRSCQQPIHHGPVLFHFDGVFKFIFFPFSNMKRWAAPYSLGISPSNMADRKSTRLNSSHVKISYAVFCLKKKIDTIYD